MLLFVAVGLGSKGGAVFRSGDDFLCKLVQALGTMFYFLLGFLVKSPLCDRLRCGGDGTVGWVLGISAKPAVGGMLAI